MIKIKCETTGCQQCAPLLVRIRKLAISLLVLGLLGATATGCIWGTMGVIHHLEILAICSLVSFLLGAGLLYRYKHKGSSAASAEKSAQISEKLSSKVQRASLAHPNPLSSPMRVLPSVSSPEMVLPLPLSASRSVIPPVANPVMVSPLPSSMPLTAGILSDSVSVAPTVPSSRREMGGKEIHAAKVLQSVWRGRKARIRVKKNFLSYAETEGATTFIDTPSSLAQLPRASTGKTPVYLPAALPIVLKQSGSPANQTRFGQMEKARQLCDRNGYRALIIPKARVYKNFIIESKLPITVHDTKEQIGFYIENRERFTQAVQEFTGFHCQSHLHDITGMCNDPYGVLSKSPIGRYDNVALYLVGERGYIGLIDLESFKPECRKMQDEWCYYKCRDVIHLFPYHFDEILTVAKKYDPNIEHYLTELNIDRDHALLRFKLAYEDHLTFVKEKGITPDNPLKMSEISPERREHLKKLVVSKIREENEDENCLGEKPDETIALFEEVFPFILDSTTNFILNFLKSGNGAETISSYRELLSYRTLQFANDCDEYKELLKQVAAKLTMVQLTKGQKNRFASMIIERIFEGLAEGGDIAYYNPSFGYGSYATHCIFC